MKVSKRSVLVVLTAVSFSAALPACPEERKEAVNQVGGAPKEQVDVARERIGKAEDKLQQNAAAAAAAE